MCGCKYKLVTIGHKKFNLEYLVIDIKSLYIKEHSIVLALISRRSKYRAGTRYNRRGIDEKGNVANFVETEQILVSNQTGQMASYVQTRGSIPLFWKQIINIKYQPKLLIEPNSATVSFNFFYQYIN